MRKKMNLLRLRRISYQDNVIWFWHYKPKLPNGKLIIWCHGTLGKLNPESKLLRKVARFRHLGYDVAAILYPGEWLNIFPKPYKDIQAVVTLAKWFCRHGDIHHIDLLGVSRGGWVALEGFGRHWNWFNSCLVSVAPTHIPSWLEIKPEDRLITRINKRIWRRYFIHSPVDLAKDKAESGEFVGLLYGIQDNIVPWTQGIELASLLTEFGHHNHELITDKYGNHAMIAKPENWKILVQWVLNNGGVK